MIAIDTNLLVYAHRAGTPQHDVARDAIGRAADHAGGWGIALASVFEFWAVATHPRSRGGPATADEAAAFINGLEAGGAVIWSPAPGLWERARRIATQAAISGPAVFDLHIAITARDNGATEIWSHDADFVPDSRAACT